VYSVLIAKYVLSLASPSVESMYYEPRLRDNERRVIDGKPVRGGPLPSDTAQ